MLTIETESLEAAEMALVRAWRLEELERAGFDDRLAAELAARSEVDLHTAVELVQRGCPPHLAAQILL
jgi:hypothetical protein